MRKAVVVARDGAGDLSMWVRTRGSGVHGRGRSRGEGQVWVVRRRDVRRCRRGGRRWATSTVTCDGLVIVPWLGCLTILQMRPLFPMT